MQPCPEQQDFRAHQCLAYDDVPYDGALFKWTPHYDDSEPCALTCRLVGLLLWYAMTAEPQPSEQNNLPCLRLFQFADGKVVVCIRNINYAFNKRSGMVALWNETTERKQNIILCKSNHSLLKQIISLHILFVILLLLFSLFCFIFIKIKYPVLFLVGCLQIHFLGFA